MVVTVFCSNILVFRFAVSLRFFGGPGGFRKVGEANRKDFLLVSSKSDLMERSYSKKHKLTIEAATAMSIRMSVFHKDNPTKIQRKTKNTLLGVE